MYIHYVARYVCAYVHVPQTNMERNYAKNDLQELQCGSKCPLDHTAGAGLKLAKQLLSGVHVRYPESPAPELRNIP